MDIAALWNPVNIRTFALGFLTFTVLSWLLRRPKKLPPGPWGWPLLGNIPQLARIKEPAYEALSKMGDRYGPVFSLKVFNQLVVILQGYDVTKQAMSQFQLSGRPAFEIGQVVTPGHGILSATGPPWVELRRFSTTALRKLGMGKPSLGKQISTEAQFLLEEIRTQGGKSFNPKDLVQNAVANVICYLVFGSRFEYTDAGFKDLQKALNITHELGGAGGVIEFMPLFAKLSFLPAIKKRIAFIKAFEKIMSNLLKEHEKGYQPEIARDYTDALYNEMRAKEGSGQPTYISPATLYHTVSDLFGAGTETVTSTFSWVLLYMIAYPETQAKVQRELDFVVGRDRLPQLSDKPKLVFTQAVLNEIQRVSIVPLGVPHKCTEDTIISGFHIPEGAFVLTNLWHILHDPREWTNPKEFRPERFLDSDGNLVRREKFIPFGIGRRLCLGESMARMELFIFFAVLLHQFSFKAPEGGRVSFEARLSLTLAPNPYQVVAIPRN